MVKVKNIGVNALVAAMVLTGPLLCVTSTPALAVDTNSADEQTFKSQAADYSKAYTAGDARAIATMWTPDGTYTDEDGLELKGRSEIEKYFASGFKRFGAQPLQINIESVRFPASDVAIEQGTCRVLKGPDAGTVTRYSIVHVKQDNRWLMAAVTESNGVAKAASDSLKDFGWLKGSWTAKGAQGTMHLKADWAGEQKFIHCTYEADSSDSTLPKSGQVQIIGWNPRTKQITSWHFSPKGGFGTGRWLEDGDSFIECTNGVEPDGTLSRSINTIHKLSDNSFTWRSTGRMLGNGNLPDTPEITVTRDQ
jgi:uncharacterized protein (TIGR02246 family)